MKLFFVTTFLSTLFAYGLTDYEHSYGHGHGGGHGFYGYPVGRKWGYSTYIKHPPPKHHGYGGHQYGSQGYGVHGFRNQGYGFSAPSYGHANHGYWPNVGNSYGHGGDYPGYSHTYRHDYIPYVPFGAYEFGRKRRNDVYGHDSGYNSYGQHKNHNYGGGDGQGAHSKTYNTGYVKPEFGNIGGFDSILEKNFPNYLIDLNLPDNFQQLIY